MQKYFQKKDIFVMMLHVFFSLFTKSFYFQRPFSYVFMPLLHITGFLMYLLSVFCDFLLIVIILILLIFNKILFNNSKK